MKTTTTSIIELLKSDNFINLYDLMDSVKEYNFEDEIYQDVSIEDAYNDLSIIIDIIKTSIKKNNLFDNVTTYSIRNFTLSTLNNINTYISNIKNGTNHVSTLIQHVEQLKEKLNIYLIESILKGTPLYYEKLREVNYLKSKYTRLISDLKKAESIKNETDNIFNNVTEKHNEITEIEQKIEESQITIDTIKKDIEERYGEIKLHDKNISDYKTQSNQNKDEITEFYEEIDEFKSKIESSIDASVNNIKESKNELKKIFDDSKYNTELIINKNESLQENIYDLLGKAIGTNLYKSFYKKVIWMRGQSLAWLLLLIVSIVFISVTGKDVIEILGELLKNGA